MLWTLPILRDLILQIRHPLIYSDNSSHGISHYQTVASSRLTSDGSLSEPIGMPDAATYYSRMFSQDEVRNGIYRFRYPGGYRYAIVRVFNNNGYEIIPDSIEHNDNGDVSIYLSSYGIISGNWKVISSHQMETSYQAEVVHVVCEGCANPVLEVYKQDLIYLGPFDRITAAMFRSVIRGIPDPVSGQIAECPFCHRELMTSLRNTWKRYRIQSNGEWDE
jgi:hypothetical protein